MKNFLIISFVFIFGATASFFYIQYVGVNPTKKISIDKNSNTGSLKESHELPVKNARSSDSKDSRLADPAKYSDSGTGRLGPGVVGVPSGTKPSKEVIDTMQKLSNM